MPLRRARLWAPLLALSLAAAGCDTGAVGPIAPADGSIEAFLAEGPTAEESDDVPIAGFASRGRVPLTGVSMTPGDDVPVGQPVTLSVGASVADSAIAWAITAGTQISAFRGKTVSWTPSRTGTSAARLTVNTGRGGKSVTYVVAFTDGKVVKLRDVTVKAGLPQNWLRDNDPFRQQAAPSPAPTPTPTPRPEPTPEPRPTWVPTPEPSEDTNVVVTSDRPAQNLDQIAAMPPAQRNAEIARFRAMYEADREALWWWPRDLAYYAFHAGRYGEAADWMAEGMANFRQHNERMYGVYYHYRSDALVLAGRFGEAVDVLRQGLDELPEDERPGLRDRLARAAVNAGDEAFLAGDRTRALGLYREAARSVTPGPSPTYTGVEERFRLYLAEHDTPALPQAVKLRGTAFLTSVGNVKLTEADKRIVKHHAQLLGAFFRAASRGRMDVAVDVREFAGANMTQVEATRSDRFGEVRYPRVESMENLAELERQVRETTDRTDFYVVVTGGHPELTNSNSYGYRMPMGPGQAAPARSRIDIRYSTLRLWVHELNHAISGAYWPAMGDAHRYENHATSYDPGAYPGPCGEGDGDCLNAWPRWIAGVNEADYYIGLFEQTDALGGWERMTDIGKLWAPMNEAATWEAFKATRQTL